MMKKFLLFAAALLGAAGVFAAPESQIVYPEYAVLASGGDIIVRDYEGTPVLKIGKLDFAWSSPVAVPVRVEQTAKDTFKIVYRIDRDDSGKVASKVRSGRCRTAISGSTGGSTRRSRSKPAASCSNSCR